MEKKIRDRLVPGIVVKRATLGVVQIALIIYKNKSLRSSLFNNGLVHKTNDT